MEGINYNAINFNKLENKQIGLGDDVKAEKDSLKDGLTQKEMKKLDKDGDGVLTEAEFKAGCKGNDKVKDKYWDAYADFCGLKSSKTESGGTKVSQNVQGQKANTYFDKEGEATKQSVKNSDGTRTVTDLKTGTEKIVQKDGSYTKYYENGTQVSVSVNGTKVKTNDDGQITKIVSKTEDGKENVNSFKYNDKGEMTKVTINGQEYTNGENCTITVKEDGKTVVKDKDGKNLLVTKQDSKNNTIVYNYENGKKAEAVKVDTDGNALTTASYENGLKTSKTNCKNSNVRTYERDAEGNLTKSTDTSKDGVKLSEQTYTKVNGENKWATRTFFDEKGDVEKTKTYKYKENDDDSYTATAVTTNNKGEVVKKSKSTYNWAGEIKTKITKKDGKTIVTEYDDAGNYTQTTYSGNDKDRTKPLSQKEYSSLGSLEKKTTFKYDEKGNLVSSKEYENNNWTEVHMPKNGETYAPGQEITTKDANGKIVKKETIIKDENNKVSERTITQNGKTTVIAYTYDEKGNLVKTKEQKPDGTYEVTKYEDGEAVKKAFYDKDKNKTGTYYSFDSIIKDKYPNITDAQLSKIKDKLGNSSKDFKEIDNGLYYAKSNFSDSVWNQIDDILNPKKPATPKKGSSGKAVGSSSKDADLRGADGHANNYYRDKLTNDEKNKHGGTPKVKSQLEIDIEKANPNKTFPHNSNSNQNSNSTVQPDTNQQRATLHERQKHDL